MSFSSTIWYLPPTLALAAAFVAGPAHAQNADLPPKSTITKIVMLGTGNPRPLPEKMGASIAIIVNGTPYIVDAGPGLVRRSTEALRAGAKGLEGANLQRVFLTHLHTDHTLGLPDLLFTPWVMGRATPLQVYGPAGTSAMMQHIAMAWREDNDVRINGLEHGNATGNKAIAHDVKPGIVYRDSNVTVTAFAVHHGSWKEALGYRFQTPDRVIVISGDASPGDVIAQQCNGCDVLLHEVYSEFGYQESNPSWREYVRSFHTSTKELADLATKAKPKWLVLYHQMYFGGATDTDARLLEEIRKGWPGRVIASRDLDVY